MKFEDVASVVRDVPYISQVNARYLYDLIVREKIARILELGIAHGSATCYMAAALDELGHGTITSVDLIENQNEFRPTPEEQLTRLHLAERVSIVRMQTGYTWFLHDEITRLTTDDVCTPEYDLCIIDGPKNWTIDGLAFFLADKVLRNQGWIIFDDYDWTYAAAEARRDATDGVTHRLLSDVERVTPHIREVFELLVKQHPNYAQFFRMAGNDWAIARKVTSSQRVYSVVHRETFPDIAARAATSALRRVRRLIGE